MPPSLRRSRASLAAFIVAGTAAFGVGAIGTAAPAAAATCGLGQCASGSITSVNVTETGGASAIVVTWTPTDNTYYIRTDPKPSVTVTWSPTTTPPAGAPQPPKTSDTVTGDCVPTSGQGPTKCTFMWPPGLISGGYVLNGTYKIDAAAVQCLTVVCSTAAPVPTVTKEIANPGRPPSNVNAALASNQKDTIVTWDASPEPDVLGYRVSRVSAGGQATGFYQCRLPAAPPDPKIPTCPAKLSATDIAPGGGQYTYQVSAFRYGATYDSSKLVEAKSSPSKPLAVPGPTSSTVKGSGGLPAFGAFSNKSSTPGKPASGGFNPNLAPAPSVAPAPDPGFQPTLPYQAPNPNSPKSDPATVGQTTPTPKAKGSVGSIALIGAGLLVAVVAFHGLWLRGEVKRAGVLEVLEPET